MAAIRDLSLAKEAYARGDPSLSRQVHDKVRGNIS